VISRDLASHQFNFPEVVQLRLNFLVQLFKTAPTLRRLMEDPALTLIKFFESMVYERSTIPLVAKFAHEVLEVFYATPVFRLSAVWRRNKYLFLMSNFCCFLLSGFYSVAGNWVRELGLDGY
jgi:hypothetical protein